MRGMHKTESGSDRSILATDDDDGEKSSQKSSHSFQFYCRFFKNEIAVGAFSFPPIFSLFSKHFPQRPIW